MNSNLLTRQMESNVERLGGTGMSQGGRGGGLMGGESTGDLSPAVSGGLSWGPSGIKSASITASTKGKRLRGSGMCLLGWAFYKVWDTKRHGSRLLGKLFILP